MFTLPIIPELWMEFQSKHLQQAATVAYWGFFVFIVGFTPVYFFFTALIEKRKPDRAQIVISPVAVIIWVLAIGGPFALIEGYNQGYGLLLLGPFTLIVPFVDWGISEYLDRKKRSRQRRALCF